MQCVTKIHSTVRVCRSKKETARQRNPCSLLIHAVLALSCTESVGRFKIQLALGEEIRGGGKGGLLEKALSIIPGTAAPRPPCVMMREVYRELGGQPVDGNDHTHDPTHA